MSDIPCFADGPWIGSYEDGCGSSCMLPEGHEGPHEWTSNRNILIRSINTNKPEIGREDADNGK